MPDGLSKWWDEDAERLNAMAKLASKKGVLIPVGEGLPPLELDESGEEIVKARKSLLELLRGKANASTSN